MMEGLPLRKALEIFEWGLIEFWQFRFVEMSNPNIVKHLKSLETKNVAAGYENVTTFSFFNLNSSEECCNGPSGRSTDLEQSNQRQSQTQDVSHTLQLYLYRAYYWLKCNENGRVQNTQSFRIEKGSISSSPSLLENFAFLQSSCDVDYMHGNPLVKQRAFM